jgi:hypothetical protein
MPYRVIISQFITAKNAHRSSARIVEVALVRNATLRKPAMQEKYIQDDLIDLVP